MKLKLKRCTNSISYSTYCCIRGGPDVTEPWYRSLWYFVKQTWNQWSSTELSGSVTSGPPRILTAVQSALSLLLFMFFHSNFTCIVVSAFNLFIFFVSAIFYILLFLSHFPSSQLSQMDSTGVTSRQGSRHNDIWLAVTWPLGYSTTTPLCKWWTYLLN